ncbi:Oligoendopeptidase F [Seminavis robusta]|uniref:Oligoendopeptidase F n=1 Tax=Seminavis robusta TaxID=568900 RepID=A0A9N8HPZ4_9STRA|nr:Oligoendopeptidase F [Seminavis robusta]|eukprot:Sro1381_g267840.1 Oligoendopeptidase F (453) ;mRNA; r:17626-19201
MTVSFYDKELSLMRFVIKEGDEPVNMEVLLSTLGSSKDSAVRATCLKALNEGLGGAMGRVAALSLSTVSGSWHIENKERSYKNLRTQRNLGNNCPDEVVDSLLVGVRTAGVPLCKRYYALKKNILKKTQGLETFRWSDRNAPIDIEGGKKEDEKIPWTDCVKIVEKGYRSFSPRMAEMFMGFVNEKRIDVPASNGKKGGAYCSAAVPGIGPFQLLNYGGTKRDVATTAHESGHAVHDVMAYPKGYLQFHPPLTLAETASIFGEMIVFRDLLEMAKSKGERLSLLMSKIDDILNSVVRQCSFDRFEELAHTARQNGELTVDELDKFWMQTVEEYYGKLGDADAPFEAYDDITHLWAYVPHFHHVPFYVYSYAFADLVVGTLYHSFQTTPDGFEGRLLDLLAAGGTKDFAEALQPFGLDPKSPSFWEDAIKAHLGGLMAEAEALAAELGYSATA